METMIVFLIVAAAVFLGVRALRGPSGGCGCSNGSSCGLDCALLSEQNLCKFRIA